jgi:hypothetical protein
MRSSSGQTTNHRFTVKQEMVHLVFSQPKVLSYLEDGGTVFTATLLPLCHIPQPALCASGV